MKLYYALVKRSDNNKIQDVIFTKESFSWAAFLLSGIWFLYHKMWKEFYAVMFFTIIGDILFRSLGRSEYLTIELIFFFVIAMNANYWRENDLKKKGYSLEKTVFANNENEAEIGFFSEVSTDQLDDSLLNLESSNKKSLRDYFKL